eukprot:CAMPEP_0204634768 /NCGR_PEP_ID=MMETSP0717-20131115/30024_1 /ASSEMBLY_ACC=CAM_ASM_000666 /TAXON_ID=230516 /ORGANISM="Chaetoceros curvisetus" /LENGTH=403 /DNA_ID=CAMNT_0051653311 /DNA_START=162 /DNA_END=1373 /DNA_ORIENTATION=-
MPQDVYEVYPFAGEALGTVRTCEVQGVFNLIGTLFVLGSNTTLNLYYVCTFRFTMPEEKFKRYIMPVMLMLYMTLSIVVTPYILRKGLVNPTPFGNYCTFRSYPSGCTDEEKGQEDETTSTFECIRGGNGGRNMALSLTYIILGGTFVILVASMILVVVTVLDVELSIRRRRRGLRDTSSVDNDMSNPVQEQIEDFKRTRVVMIQALMYISAFLLTWIFGVLLQSSTTTVASSNIVASLKVFFRPLQGFFNAMIFVYQKVYTLRQSNRTLTFSGAFKQVILSPHTVPQEIVSRIEIATEDIGDRLEEMRRHANENNGDTPPISSNSGVSSSSLGEISLGDLFSIAENDSDDENTTLDGFSVKEADLIQTSASLSSSAPPVNFHNNDVNQNLSHSRSSMDTRQE